MVPMVRRESGELAEEFNESILEAWEAFKDLLEISGQMAYRQFRQMLGQSYIRDGEAYAQILQFSKRIAYPSDIPLALAPLEADYIATIKSTSTIVQGVEITRAGQIKAWHVYKRHPSETRVGAMPTTETIRISADKMLALRHLERLGQLRGVSMLAPAAETLADTDEYLQAERIAMKFAAAVGLKITQSTDPATSPLLNEDGKRVFDIEPGMVLDNLAPGEDASMMSIDRPGNSFEPYINTMRRDAAAAVGVYYSAISNNFTNSYSAERGMMTTVQAFYEYQQSLQVTSLDQRIHRLFMQALSASGRLRGRPGIDRRTINDADFIPPAMPWIDPQKEAAADVLAVQNGFESRAGIVRKRGGNLNRIDKEREQDDGQVQESPDQDADTRAA